MVPIEIEGRSHNQPSNLEPQAPEPDGLGEYIRLKGPSTVEEHNRRNRDLATQIQAERKDVQPKFNRLNEISLQLGRGNIKDPKALLQERLQLELELAPLSSPQNWK